MLLSIIAHKIIIKMKYHQKYTQKQFIGRGNYGKVYLVLENKTFDLFVAKKISLEGLKFTQMDKTMRQIEIHKNLKHSNIIEFREYFLEKDILIIIMEYCEYGDLSLYIKNRKEKEELLEENLIMNLYIQLLYGVKYLHQNKILHRDIKPQNIFINGQGVLKIADFGISKAMETTFQVALTLVGTPYYLSPEACKNEGYTVKSDIWSLGCVLYQMCTLKHAFQGNNVLSLANKITKQKVQQIPKNYSKKLFQVIEWMLKKNPEERPTCKQILQNEYIKQYSAAFLTQDQKSKQIQSAKEKQNIDEYDNQFLDPSLKIKEYSNEFLQDGYLYAENKQTHKNKINSPVKTNSKLQQQISPRASASSKLFQKCKSKLGDQIFSQLYSFMRGLKSQGFSQIQIEEKVRGKYNKSLFDRAMDVAQLIYIEDNS